MSGKHKKYQTIITKKKKKTINSLLSTEYIYIAKSHPTICSSVVCIHECVQTTTKKFICSFGFKTNEYRVY